MQAIYLAFVLFFLFQDISSAKSLMGYTQVTWEIFNLHCVFLAIFNESAEILSAVKAVC